MHYTFQPMTEEAAREVAHWHYDGIYAFYDMGQDPEDLAELLDPANWQDCYYAVRDGVGTLIGFFCFTRDAQTMEIGLGLRPDLTGRGLGPSFLEAGLTYARERFYAVTFRLSVAAFNQRAIQVYQRAGFRIVREFPWQTNGGEYPFLEMIREA